jgi:hypothetical protein
MAHDRAGRPVLPAARDPGDRLLDKLPVDARVHHRHPLTRQDLAEAFDLFWPSRAGPGVLRLPGADGRPVRPAVRAGPHHGLRPAAGPREEHASRPREEVSAALRRYDGHVHFSTYLRRLVPSARCYLNDRPQG